MDANKMTMLKLCVLALFVAYAYAQKNSQKNDGFCVCEAYGNYHYKTFDGALISFEGSCGYTLSASNKGVDRPFKITIWNIKMSTYYQKIVEIQLESVLLIIYEGNDLVANGYAQQLPYSDEGGVNVSMEGSILKVYLAWMLTILFDGKQQVTIKVPESYRNKMTGICGDCNKNATDDYREKGSTKNLRRSSSSAYQIGKSYKFINDHYDKDCPVNLATSQCDNSKKCFPIYSDAFRSCYNVLGNTTVFNLFEACKVDVCMGKEQDKCPAIERFATKCKQENIPIKWKAMAGCEDPCGDKPCKNNATCTRNATNYTCKCKYGFIGDNCETVDLCEPNPCKNDGVCKANATNYTCLCKKGFTGVNCEKAMDDCLCRLFGESHYITFDGQPIHFGGKCKYTLAASKPSSGLPQFSVEVKNRRGNEMKLYTRIIDVKFNGNTFRMLAGSKLMVNGELTMLPLVNYMQVNATYSFGSIIVKTDFGLKVEFDGEHKVFVTVPSTYTGDLTGICGNCNLMKDDYSTKSGDNVASKNNKFSLIGASYEVVDDSDKPETNCTVVDYVAKCSSDVQESCDPITSAYGVFRYCMNTNLKMIYLESCNMDACKYKDSKQMKTKAVCQTYEAIARECEKVNQFLYWRPILSCKKKCKANEVYTYKSPKCQDNCLDVPCDGGYGEGCECQSNFKLMGDTCVIPTKCGCSYKGKPIVLNDDVLTTNCSERVKCSTGNKINKSPGCKKNEGCLLQSSKRICQCPPSFKTDGNKCLVPTFPQDLITSALPKFFRVSMAYIEGKSLHTISTNRPGVCAVICLNNTNCKSFNFDEMKDECNLFSVNAVDNTLVTINCPFQDYYQLIESKDIVIRGGSIFPCGPLTEFAVVKTLEDCKTKCTKNKCKSMEYSLVNQECSISNSTGKNFELNGDDEFVYYGNLE